VSITLPPPTAKIKSTFCFLAISIPSKTLDKKGLDLTPPSSMNSIFS